MKTTLCGEIIDHVAILCYKSIVSYQLSRSFVKNPSQNIVHKTAVIILCLSILTGGICTISLFPLLFSRIATCNSSDKTLTESSECISWHSHMFVYAGLSAVGAVGTGLVSLIVAIGSDNSKEINSN